MIWPFRARTPHDARPRTPALRVESLEDRSVPAALDNFVFTPNAFGGGNFSPFGTFTGSVRTASGDVNGDGVADIITAQGTGAGSGSRVRIFDGLSARFAGRAVLISDFYAYSNVAGAGQTPGFAGGVFVAAGDLNGDGFAEVITSPGAGASGHIKVFSFTDGAGRFLGSNPTLQASFFAYPGFLGEIRATTLRQANGQTLLATASGAGVGASDVRLYNNAFNIGQVGSGTLVQPMVQTFPFPGYTGGVSVAGGDFNQLVVSRNVGQSLVSTFNLNTFGLGGPVLTPGVTFSPGSGLQNDVRLGAADINGDGRTDVLTSFAGTSGTGISAFSLAGNSAFTLGGLGGGFQGFGMFGNTWLASTSFTSPTFLSPTASTQGLSAANQGLTGGTVFFNSGASALAPGVR